MPRVKLRTGMRRVKFGVGSLDKRVTATRNPRTGETMLMLLPGDGAREYASADYRQALSQAGLIASMSRSAN